MKKRLLTVITGMLAASCVLSACGGQAASSQGGSAPAPSGAEPGSSGGAASGGKVTLEFLNSKVENAKIWETLIAKFNEENEDIEVLMTSVADPKKVLLTRVATDDVPDLSGIFPISQQDQVMQREGVFLDVTDAKCLEMVPENIVEMLKFDGKNYCLPLTTNATCLFYNTEIFEKYNLKPPATAEEVWQVCETLKQNGVQAFGLNDKNTGSLQQQFERLVACSSDQNIRETCEKSAAGQHSFTEDANMRALCEFLLKMREYGPADSLGMDTTPAREEFANGKCAMFLDGSWCAGEFVSINPDCPFSSAAPPMITVDRQVTAGNIDTAIAISAKTEYPEQCMRFLDFLVRQDVAQAFCEADLNPNIVKTVNYNVEPLKPINDMISRGEYVPSPSSIWGASLRSEIQTELQTMLIDKDIDRFLARFDQLIKENYGK